MRSPSYRRWLSAVLGLALLLPVACAEPGDIDIADARLLRAYGGPDAGTVTVSNRGERDLYLVDAAGARHELRRGQRASVAVREARLTVGFLDFPEAVRTLPLRRAAHEVKVTDPTVPPLGPLPASGVREVIVKATHRQIHVSEWHRMEAWLFENDRGLPFIRTRAGERLRITLDNAGDLVHSLDVHLTGMGGTPQVAGGRSAVVSDITVPASLAGHFGFFHCETSPISEHIRRGMAGGVMVEGPAGSLPPAREMFLGYTTWYEADADGGALRAVSFNGRADGYTDRPIELRAGELVRLYVVNGSLAPADTATLRLGDVPLRVHQLFVSEEPSKDGVRIDISRGRVIDFTAPGPGVYPLYTTTPAHIGRGALATFIVR